MRERYNSDEREREHKHIRNYCIISLAGILIVAYVKSQFPPFDAIELVVPLLDTALILFSISLAALFGERAK